MAAGTVHHSEEKLVPFLYNACTTPPPSVKKVGIYSEREGSIVYIVDLAYSSDSRSSSDIFKKKEKINTKSLSI